MNGAQALIRTLVNAGIDVCFANPGTSEMHFVAALDDVPELRTVLCLFEGVATGAADGYARMTGSPAATLLHLGPGMANGMANLHNARKAGVPVVNIIGEHATSHQRFETPLSSDIETVAGTFSARIEVPWTAADIAGAAAETVAAAVGPPHAIATLVLPADVSWGDGAQAVPPLPKRIPAPVENSTFDELEKLLASDQRCLLLLGGRATTARATASAARIAEATGAVVLTETLVTRQERGAGIPAVRRLNYRGKSATRQLAGVEHLVLVDADRPVTAFGYPGENGDLVPDGCTVHVLTGPEHDSEAALNELARRVANGVDATPAPHMRPEVPAGNLTPRSLADAVAAVLPENAIVVDEGLTAGAYVEGATATCPRHDWLSVTGGAIGIGLPLSVGAAVAAPERKVLVLQADGSAMYTIQALWTQARENLDVTTLVLNNRSYAILSAELQRVGAERGEHARSMLDLSNPDLDFVALATGMGVPASRVNTAHDLVAALSAALERPGPCVVEAML